MKEKRKRIPAGHKSRPFLRILLILAAVLSFLVLIAFLVLTYITWQIGEHEYRRALVYVGIDPDLEIAQTINDVLPNAKLKFEFLKTNLLNGVGDDSVVVLMRDSFEVSRPHLVLCLRGQFELLVSSEEDFNNIVKRIAGFAADIGFRHYAEHDDQHPHPNPLLKESHIFGERGRLRGDFYRRIYLTWVGRERDPTMPGLAPITSRYRLGFDFNDLGCFWS